MATQPDSLRERLLAALVERNLFDREALEDLLRLQKKQGGSLIRLLTEQKKVDPTVLATVLSEILRLPMLQLSKMELDPDLADLVPRRMAYHYQMVPIALIDRQLTIAMADPTDVLAMDQLVQKTGLRLSPVIAPSHEIQEALNRIYGGAIPQTLEEMKVTERTPSGLGGGLELLTEDTPQAVSNEELIRLTQENAVVRWTHAILSEGVRLKASDILVEPFQKRLRIRYRVDGLFREGDAPPYTMHAGIVSRIKVMAYLNIAEHRLPQDGRIKFSVDGRDVDFRVSILPTYHGEKICLRILDKSQVMLDIDRLGFDPKPLSLLKDAMRRPHGMVLITGPTGSGKTTTMYSLLRLVDRPEKNLVTVEDPVEYDLTGINQVSIRPEIGLTFAAGLRSILRQDPDVIMVGEIRDNETADIAVKAALTGHLVLSTLHTNDALGAVARLKNMGIDPYLISACLLLVGAQRLPRKVCPRCSEPVHLPKEVMERLGLPADGQYRRGRGCLECRSTGLDGRIGLLEAIPVTQELRLWIERGASSVQLREVAKGLGYLFLRDYAVAKAAQGVIPLEEVARTTVEHEDRSTHEALPA